MAGVFGVGSTAYLLNQMDRGLLRGLVVHNCYNEGYLAVERAVKGIRQGMKKERIDLSGHSGTAFLTGTKGYFCNLRYKWKDNYQQYALCGTGSGRTESNL